jgi:hypothetical protein
LAKLLENSPTSGSPIDKSLEQIRGELLDGAGGLATAARRVTRWQALLSWLTVGLLSLVALLLLDMLLRREEVGLRVLSLAAWLSMLGWGASKLLRPAWRFSPTPIQVAQWIEGVRPELGERLSTAVELANLPAADSRYGSNRFREAALRAWATSGQSLHWSRHLQRRGLHRAGSLLLVVCGALVALATVWPTEMGVAFTRLTVPWGSTPWPRRDQLKILQLPAVVAAGSELQLEVIDERPPLPDGIELQMRGVGAAEARQVRTLETVAIGDLAVGNLPTITAPFEVRAVGGDDQRMPWQRVEVVQPPELTEFRFVIQPPPYTGLDRSEVVGRRIAVLAGSQVEFTGRFDRPVTRVIVRSQAQKSTDDSTADTNESAQQAWTVSLDNDGRGLHLGAPASAMLEVQQSLDWQLLLVTADGLETLQPERWSVEVAEDTPPRVLFPAADLAELASNAQLSLRGEATDDLGLVAVRARLQILNDETTPPASFSIWQVPQSPASVSSAVDAEEREVVDSAVDSANSSMNSAAGEQPRELTIDATWSLAQAGSFVAGQRVAVWLEACDSSGQWGQSQVHEYDIRDQRELIESIQQKQNQLLAQVRELVDTQRRNTQLFSRTWEQTQQAGEVEREQLELFRNTAQVQRAMAEQLGSESVPQGLTQEIAKLRELLTRNRLDGTELATELQALLGNVQSLSEGAMAAATTATGQTAAVAEDAVKDKADVAQRLATSAQRAQEAQGQALRGLEQLLDRLARNESMQQVERELAQILNQQNAIRRETDRMHVERLSESPTESPAESRAERQAQQTALSADQQGLARRLDDWLARAGELQASTTSDQQAAKAALTRATEALVAAQASAQMRRSTEEIRDAQLARASTTQHQVAELLSDTLRQLGAGNQSQLGSLRNRVEGLRQTSGELSDLASAQSALSERWQAPAEATQQEQLLSEQAAVEQRTSAVASQAEQAGDASLSAEIERARTSQQQAQRAGRQNDFQQATRASQQAAEQLRQTSQQLEQRAAELEQQVAEQQMFQLVDAIEQLSAQQQPIAEQFNQWAKATTQEPSEEGQESRPRQQAEMRQAASRQEAVRQVLREVRAETTELPTFDWTLEQAELAMGRAVAAAQRYRIEPDAREASDGALRLLQLAAEAMRQQHPGDSNETPDETPDDAQAGGSQSQAEPSERPAPFVASLKLLRGLQQELNLQTLAAESIDDTVRRTGRLSELSSFQQALAAQIEQLLNEAAAPQTMSSRGDN